MDFLDALEHYGIKGMKWGVRRSEEELARAAGRPVPKPSKDAQRTAELKEKAKLGGAEALSDEQLKDLNNRLNLEQNYERLTAQPEAPSLFDKGYDHVKFVLSLGKTASEAYNLMNSPMANDIGKMLGTRKKK